MSNRLPVLAETIRQAHLETQAAVLTAAERAIEAGEALNEAKSLLRHGQWLPWLRDNVQIPERTAQLYMRIAASGLKSATVADLGLQASARPLTAKACTEHLADIVWMLLQYFPDDRRDHCLDIICGRHGVESRWHEFDREIELIADSMSAEQRDKLIEAEPQIMAEMNLYWELYQGPSAEGARQ